jgi:hypothetical protein
MCEMAQEKNVRFALEEEEEEMEGGGLWADTKDAFGKAKDKVAAQVDKIGDGVAKLGKQTAQAGRVVTESIGNKIAADKCTMEKYKISYMQRCNEFDRYMYCAEEFKHLIKTNKIEKEDVKNAFACLIMSTLEEDEDRGVVVNNDVVDVQITIDAWKTKISTPNPEIVISKEIGNDNQKEMLSKLFSTTDCPIDKAFNFKKDVDIHKLSELYAAIWKYNVHQQNRAQLLATKAIAALGNCIKAKQENTTAQDSLPLYLISKFPFELTSEDLFDKYLRSIYAYVYVDAKALDGTLGNRNKMCNKIYAFYKGLNYENTPRKPYVYVLNMLCDSRLNEGGATWKESMSKEQRNVQNVLDKGKLQGVNISTMLTGEEKNKLEDLKKDSKKIHKQIKELAGKMAVDPTNQQLKGEHDSALNEFSNRQIEILKIINLEMERRLQDLTDKQRKTQEMLDKVQQQPQPQPQQPQQPPQ